MIVGGHAARETYRASSESRPSLHGHEEFDADGGKSGFGLVYMTEEAQPIAVVLSEVKTGPKQHGAASIPAERC